MNSQATELPDEAERAAFEAEFTRPDVVTWDGSNYQVREGWEGSYRIEGFLAGWRAWQARAALEHAQRVAQPAVLSDEILRAEFEHRWQLNPLNPLGSLERNENGDYSRMFTHCCWSEFKAGAAFAATPSAGEARDAWLPIETAPRDGSRILLLWKHRPARVGWWTDEESGTGWKCDGDQVVPAAAYQADATHWMPLPAAPMASGSAG